MICYFTEEELNTLLMCVSDKIESNRSNCENLSETKLEQINALYEKIDALKKNVE